MLTSTRRTFFTRAGICIPPDEQRLAVGKAFSQDLKNLQKLFIFPQAFPVLQYFSCTLDRSPPPNPDPAFGSFRFDDSEVFALGERLQKEHGFVVTRAVITRAGLGEEYSFFLSAEKLEQQRAEDDDLEERKTTPGLPQPTWSTIALLG